MTRTQGGHDTVHIFRFNELLKFFSVKGVINCECFYSYVKGDEMSTSCFVNSTYNKAIRVSVQLCNDVPLT